MLLLEVHLADRRASGARSSCCAAAHHRELAGAC